VALPGRPRSTSQVVLGVTVAAVTIGLAFLPPATGSAAFFNDVQGARVAISADTLQPPTGLGVTGGTGATLVWTPTGDAYAAGYQVERATTSGGTYAVVGTATPVTASGLVDVPATDGTYWYRVRSWVSNWQSGPVGPVSADVLMGVTGFKACTAQAADSGGDANGYQGSPANACAIDGAVATDTNSGTGTSTLCTSTAKDKHRFSAFGLAVPSTATSIRGITVRYRAGIDAIAGTNRICAQLSWNAGASWTAAQLAPITATALTTYTLGGPLFLWGRTWTAAQLSDASFQLRLIDVSSNNARDFSLDGVEVQVDYTP